jgi:hypothetical protein
MAVLLIANLKQFSNRVATAFTMDEQGKWIVTGSEPPVDLMAHDVLESDAPRRELIGNRDVTWTPRSTTRVYAFTESHIPSPGDGRLNFNVGRYFMSIESQSTFYPIQQLRTSAGQYNIAFDSNTDATHIAKDVAGHPNLTRIIVWDQFGVSSKPQPDPIIRQLGAKWALVSILQFPVYDHWTWIPRGDARRREYERK